MTNRRRWAYAVLVFVAAVVLLAYAVPVVDNPAPLESEAP